MIKRVFAALMCALIWMTAGSVTAFARTEPVDFTVNAPATATAGETVIVSVMITEDSYFTNATLSLHYDPTMLSYTDNSATYGAAAPSSTWVMANNFADKGYVKTAYILINPMTEGGEILTFEFTALKDGPVETSLTFEECVGEENGAGFVVNYTVNGGSLTDAPPVPEDVVVATEKTPAPKAEAPDNILWLWVVIGVAAAVVIGGAATMVAITRKKR